MMANARNPGESAQAVQSLFAQLVAYKCGIRRRLWLCQYGIGRRYDCDRWVGGVANPLCFPIFLTRGLRRSHALRSSKH